MAQTPNSTATSYCTVARLFRFKSWTMVADMMRVGDDPVPSKSALLDDTSDAGAELIGIGLAACGQLESACFIGQRYSAADLAALTGAGSARRDKIIADLWFWMLMQIKQPGSADPKNCPGAMEALEELDRLRSGERIFSFTESADAGLPRVSDPDIPSQANPLVSDAAALFGNHRTGTKRRVY